MGKAQTGEFTVPAGVNVWPHEIETAKALARSGRTLRFIPKSEGQYVTTPDIVMDGLAWEMKAPKASSVAAIERNVRRACEQSPNVVLDVRRMKGVPAGALEREARACARRIGALRRLLLVAKDGAVLDIM